MTATLLRQGGFFYSAPIVGAGDHTGPFVILSAGRSPEPMDPFPKPSP